MKCPDCGFDVGDFQFCPNCGAGIQKTSPISSENDKTTDANEKVMINCPFCGAPQKPEAQFCGICGKAIAGDQSKDSISESNKKPEENNQSDKPSDNASKKPSGNKKMIIGAAAAIALLIIIIAIIIGSKGHSSSFSSDSQDIAANIQTSDSQNTTSSDDIYQVIAVADAIMTQSYNTGDLRYRGYDLEDNFVAFNILYYGAAEIYESKGKEDLADVEDKMNELCSILQGIIDPTGYHTVVYLLNDKNENNVLFASLDGATYYSSAD